MAVTGISTERGKLKTNEEKKEFYERCSEILGIHHEYNEPVSRRTRWNNRRLGNGRYPGFGLIQCYGSSVKVTSRTTDTKMFKSYNEVYEYLKSLRGSNPVAISESNPELS